MQGFNMGRYYPPSTDSSPKFNSILRGPQNSTVRFEMPFAIWCSHCPQSTIIPQGVRFNATKTKVGNYYSTPIWSFKMKHSICGGEVEIRTDPAASEYVVVSGGRRRDYGDDGERGAERLETHLGEILTEEERERRRLDAFAALEGKTVDQRKAEKERERVQELWLDRERDWADPYAANRRARSGFRAERKLRIEREKADEGIMERLGLGIRLLAECEEDKVLAEAVEYGTPTMADADIKKVERKGLFEKDQVNPLRMPSLKRTRKEMLAESQKLSLQRELKGNTRAALDPFLLENGHSSFGGKGKMVGRKRKRAVEEPKTRRSAEKAGSLEDPLPPPPTLPTKISLALVDYESD